MSRLSLRIYLAFVAVVLIFFALSVLLFWAVDDGRHRQPLADVATAVELLLPPDAMHGDALQERLDRFAVAFDSGLAVFDREGRRLAEAGPFVPMPRLHEAHAHWLRGRRRGPPAAALPLSDGRWVVAQLGPDRGPGWHGLAMLGLFALALGAGAYPVARGITRRLERLSASVDALGQGELQARAPIEGRDEVARLAQSFNRAAERIEALVGAQRTLLASASHELRSPLARLRVAAEILGDDTALSSERLSELRGQLAADVAELDAGVEELLVVSRLDLLDTTAAHEPVDLLALAAEVAAPTSGSVTVSGDGAAPPAVIGDARSLRHLLRNLIANAERHAPGSPVEIAVGAQPDGPGVRLCVADRGPGIPEDEREAVFDPFARGRAAADGRGLGLGLAIVRQIARHHGGDASACAREGGGTVIEVDLPGHPDAPRSPPSANRHPRPASTPAG